MKQILVGKRKNLIFSLKLAFGSAMLLTASFGISLAATGDVLYENCTSGRSCTGAGSATGWTRTVVSTGCSSGECLKLVASPNPSSALPNRWGAGNTPIGTTSVAGKKEITVVYKVKFNEESSAIKGGIIKAIRPYNGGENMIIGTNDVSNNTSPSGAYAAGFDMMYATTQPVVDDVRTLYYPVYCQLLSSNDYQCPTRIQYTFTVNGMSDFGTTWRTERQYIKVPTTKSSDDGIWKVWIDDVLVLSAKFNRKDASDDAFSKLTFYPSSEADEYFEHWMDEMTIYEGYVPPNGDVAMSSPIPSVPSSPSAPSDFKAGS